MSTYSKAQEDRMEEKMVRAGFKLIEDTARRKKFHCDRIFYHKGKDLTLAVDHKSTRNEKGIRIEKEQLEKVKEEAGGDKIGVITFSLFNSTKIYAIIEVEDLGTICDW